MVGLLLLTKWGFKNPNKAIALGIIGDLGFIFFVFFLMSLLEN